MTFAITGAAGRYQSDPLAVYANGLPGHGGMSSPQRKFHDAPQDSRSFRAANDVGKSYAGGFEAWCHLLNSHPYRETPGDGSEGWLLCPDLKAGWKAVSQTMRKLEPPGVLDPACHFVPGIGYLYRSRKIIRINNANGGGLMVGNGCKQDLQSLEAAKIAWLWVDEPPKEAHFHACRSRLVNPAPVWLTLTPINRPVEYLRNIVDGDPEAKTGPLEPGWLSMQVALTYANAPHRTREHIDTKIAQCPDYEMAQRIRAEWEGYTIGRMVPGFSDANVFTDEDTDRIAAITAGDVELCFSGDYGERPGATVFYLQAWIGGRLYVLGEWVSKERMTPAEEVAAMTDELLAPWGVKWTMIQKGVGDSNSSGKHGVGLSMNEEYERCIGRACSMTRPPFQMSTPWKGAGSVKWRPRMLSAAFLEGNILVFGQCTKLIHSLRHWMGEGGDIRHAWDGFSYGAEGYFETWFGRPGKMVLRA